MTKLTLAVRLTLTLALVLALAALGACGGDEAKPTIDAAQADPDPDASAGSGDANGIDAPPGACPVDEIRFTQATGCQNDGSVEFCIPDNNPQLQAQLKQIEPMIMCAAGGGRAGCNDPPGLLLCFYPTAVPDECVAQNGAMTDDAWADMCAIAAFPEITEIVPTIFE